MDKHSKVKNYFKDKSMKRLNLTQLIALMILVTNVLISAMEPSTGVYLENNYGAVLNYRKSALDTQGERIGNNVRVFIGDVNYLPELSIRATGKGSQWVSYYHDLSHILLQIKMFQSLRPNDDAVISVEPSTIGWNISYRWEPKSKTLKAFEYTDFPQEPITPITPIIEEKTQTPEPTQPTIVPTEETIIKEEPVTIKEEQIVVQTKEQIMEQEKTIMKLKKASERLQAIKNGALGPEYAKKATEICSANYAPAEKLGKVNLCTSLQKNLVSPQYDIHSKAKITRKPLIRPTIEEIKQTIDSLHRALARYKSRGEAV